MLNGLINNEINQDEYFNVENIIILYETLPKHRRGLTFIYKDINIIVINKIYRCSFHKDIILHEIAHIELKHCSSNKPIFLCEYEANNFVKNLLN